MAEATTAELLDAVGVRVAALAARVRALAAELETARQHQAERNGDSTLPLFADPPERAPQEKPAPHPPADVHCEFPSVRSEVVAPDRLRVQMDFAGLTKLEFAEVFDVPPEAVQSWLTGERPIPGWVLPAVYIFELLTPSERRRFLRPAAARSSRNPAKVHPFARIEEL